MVMTEHVPRRAARWLFGVMLSAALPAASAGEVLDARSRGEDNRTERGNEALTDEGAWAGTLTPPVALNATQPHSHAAPRSKIATAAKKPRQRVKQTAAARRARPETAHSPITFEQIRRAAFAPVTGH